MKSISLFVAMLFATTLASAQANHFNVFSEEGFPFYLIVNGVAQNDKPETSVKMQDVKTQNLKLKFIFDDETLGEVDKTAFLNTFGKEYTYKIKKSASGDWVLKLESSTPVAGLLPPPPVVQQTTVVQQGGTSVSTSTNGTYYNASSSGTNSSFATNAGGGMSVNVSGIGVNPNLPGGLPSGHDVSMAVNTYQAVHDHYTPPAPTHYVMVGYNGPIGCPWPMDDAQFATARQSVASNAWDETKLTVSKQIISANCLTCAQVKVLMQLMSWEESKLDLAKFAYKYTYDLGNYYQLNDAFEWESSTTELNKHINGQ
jgi:hypothetical protein